MRFPFVLFSLLSLVAALPQSQPAAQPTFSRNIIFTPPDNYNDPRVLYARSAQLPDDHTLLATWENYSPEPPQVYFPIYRSTDNGSTWTEISRVQDTQQNWGLRYQPFLYILPTPFAGYKAGTVLLSGSSIPTDLSHTQIELYASTDRGQTWTFLSHIAAGGEARPSNGLTPVWEPFLLLHNSKLLCFYSDQRDNATHGQKMVHQSSQDLLTWSDVVSDVAEPKYTDRPGMPTVAELPNGKFIMAYEYGGGPAIPDSFSFPVYYKLSSDPEAFGAAPAISLRANDGTVPSGSPYVVWSPVGGVNGTIVVGAHSGTGLFINRGLGEGKWVKVETEAASAYTRHLRVLSGDTSKLMIMGAGQLPPTSVKNAVEMTVVDMSEW